MALASDLGRGPLSLVVFRIVREGLDPLGTTGSFKAGGRYNPPNEFGALYTSFAAATAAEEVAKGLRLRGVDPGKFLEGDYWIYELELNLENVLDLTDAGVLERSKISYASLVGSEINRTRDIATQARELGYQALVVPSAAAPGDKNLVVFLDKLNKAPIVLQSRPAGIGSKPG